MALQLTGAAKSDSLANLQVELPVVVIGGGLTAIDTATESLAYYPVQVEKFLARYEALVGRTRRSARCAPAGSGRRRETADTSSSRMRAPSAPSVRPPRARGRAPRIVELLQSWGGATIAYRRRLIDAPSYTLNHEEVAKAMEEGIRFAEGLRAERSRDRRLRPCKALRLAEARLRPRARGRRPRTSCCRRAPSWSRPGRSPTPCCAREDPAPCRARRPLFPGHRRGRQAGDARARCQARAVRVLMTPSARWPRDQLLRRSPSLLRRQCREGDGRAPNRAIRW